MTNFRPLSSHLGLPTKIYLDIQNNALQDHSFFFVAPWLRLTCLMLSQICCLPFFQCVCFIGLIALRTHKHACARAVRGNDLVSLFVIFFSISFNLSGELLQLLHAQNGSQNLNKCACCQKEGREGGSTTVCYRVVFLCCLFKACCKVKFEISSNKLSFVQVFSEINDQNFEQVWSAFVDPPIIRSPLAQRAVVIF